MYDCKNCYFKNECKVKPFVEKPPFGGAIYQKILLCALEKLCLMPGALQKAKLFENYEVCKETIKPLVILELEKIRGLKDESTTNTASFLATELNIEVNKALNRFCSFWDLESNNLSIL